MKEKLQHTIADAVLTLFGVTVVPDVIASSDAVHGEYSSNIALRLSKELKKSPMDIALQVKEFLDSQSKMSSQDGEDQSRSQNDQNDTKKNPKGFCITGH